MVDEGRLNTILGKFGSDHDGEVLNAARAMQRILKAEGKDFHHLSIRVGPPPTGGSLRKKLNAAYGQLSAASAEIADLYRRLEVQSEALATLTEANRRLSADASMADEYKATAARLERDNIALRQRLSQIAGIAAGLNAAPIMPRESSVEASDMSATEFEQRCKAIVGDQHGWMRRAAEFLGITTAKVSHYKQGNTRVPVGIAKTLRSARPED